MSKKDIDELVSKLVSAFDLQATSKEGVIEGDALVEKLSDFMYKSTTQSIDERKAQFQATIRPYVEEFGKELCNKFYFHWSSVNGKGWKLAFEKEKSWNLRMRLETWKNNEIKFRTLNLLNNSKK